MYNINPIYNNYSIFFDEPTHKYTDNFGNTYKSVTTVLHEYQPKFDRDYWLKKKAKELHISEDRLAKQWATITDEACTRGTKIHDNIETNIKTLSIFYDAVKHINKENNSLVTVADVNNIDKYIKPLDVIEFAERTNNKYPDIYNIFKYYIDNGYKIYSEIGVFLPEYLVSGTIDILILREDRYIIGDWKTNRGGLKFEAGYYKKDKTSRPAQETDLWITKKEFLLPPVNNLPNCNGSIYNLQLSKYAYMVETILGIPCAGLWLAHIDSDFVLNQYGRPRRFPDGLYHIKNNPIEKVTLHKMKYLREDIIRILTDRRREVEATRIRSASLF